MNTLGYVEKLRKQFNASYYKVAQLLGVKEQTVSRWKLGKGGASEETALKIAELSKIDPALVLADLDIEHAKSAEVKAVRERIREILQRSAVAVLILFIYTGAAVEYVRCVLCQIVWNGTIRRFRSFFVRENNNKGLIHEEGKTTSLVGRFPRGRGFYIHAMRPGSAPQSDRELLVYGGTAQEHRTRAGNVALAWAAIGLGLIAISGACSAEVGYSLGTVSYHTGSGDYNERNPGLCIDTGFQRFFVSCVYTDSHKNTAALIGLGTRYQATQKISLGWTVGMRDGKSIEWGPSPIAAGMITWGTPKFAANVVLGPKWESTSAVAYLQFRYSQ